MNPTSIIKKSLSIFIIILILLCVAVIIYIVNFSDYGDPFTEFYILGEDGKADNYPTEVLVNTDATVILGIFNQERIITDYYIRVTINGLPHKELGPITLTDNERWEQGVTFTLNYTGDNQKIEFLLYKNQQDTPYLTLYLWLNVISD